jgi:hypothetical protein
VSDLSDHRIFGLATNTTFAMPIFQSLIALLLLFRSFTKNIFYFAPFSLLIFSAFINSRTSIVIFFICMIIILVYFLFSKPFTIILFSIVLLIGFPIFFDSLFPLLNEYSPSTFQWIQDGLSEFESLLTGNLSESDFYFSYLFDISSYPVPKNLIQFIFGRGIHTYSDNTLLIKSDLGFINDLWLGGLFYITTFYSLVFLMIYKLATKFYTRRVLLFTIGLSVLFLTNIKGIFFSENDLMNSLIVVYIYYII